MPKITKGSQFERDICRSLSKWWSVGIGQEERDDIFWRSSQSGGRATFRGKAGKKTFGSYGDITAMDPIGQPLIDFFTIELKRGNSQGSPMDVLDRVPSNAQTPWEKCISQAMQSCDQAESVTWMLISKRDRKMPVVFLSYQMAKRIELFSKSKLIEGWRFRFQFNTKLEKKRPLEIYATRLVDFLDIVQPETIIEENQYWRECVWKGKDGRTPTAA